MRDAASGKTLVFHGDPVAETDRRIRKEFRSERRFLTPCEGVFLDIGCSAGRLVLHVAEQARLAVGMDISLEQIGNARAARRRSGLANAAFVAGDLHSPPFREGTFAAVASRYTLHHTDLDETLPIVGGLVAPRGRLFLRDIAMRIPAFQKFRAWHAFLAALRAIDLSIGSGPLAGLRLFRFMTTPESLRHATVENRLVTQREYRRIHRRRLPGCEFRPARGTLRLREGPMVFWVAEAH